MNRLRLPLGIVPGFLAACCFSLSTLVAAQPPVTLDLWPGPGPGDKAPTTEEQDLTKTTDDLIAGKRLIRLGHVSKPTLTLYRPDPAKDTGATILVCPGGAYHILALDLEGTEVCEWLNTIGVTGALLKYRVPRREGVEKHVPALQDAQRALGLLRSRAKELGIKPDRIGVLGFSAGGHLAAAASANYSSRTYPVVDALDQTSCRPDFTVLIYPAYLTQEKDLTTVAPELPITTNTPPTFISISQDDPVHVENAVFFSLALKKAGVPTELHVYPSGGHGYGLRRTDNPVTHWPDRVKDWMRARGLLSSSSAGH